MSKKPSLSIQCKQSSLMQLHQNANVHSLSKKKQFLSIVTPSQRDCKHIKTLKQIKRIAQGIKTTPALKQKQEVVTKKKVIPANEVPSFISEGSAWKKNLTIDLKPLQLSEKSLFEWSARTMATRFEANELVLPQTPINRLLMESTISNYDH